MSVFDDIWNFVKHGPGGIFGSKPFTFQAPTPATTINPLVTDSVDAVGGGAVIKTLGDAVTGTTDFFKMIVWLFYPHNILRAVEFVMGLFLAGWGLSILSRGLGGGRRGASSHPVIRSALSVTPAGRAVRISQGRRMGRREGQREAARMEARQTVTRPQREASALERQQINRNARQASREQ
jgi:hypothetical protein